jgi:membrane protease YdiL (CAAX protease family)
MSPGEILQTGIGGKEIRTNMQTRPEGGTKAKLLALVEILLVYGVFQGLAQVWRYTEALKWETRNLGWSYIGGLLFFIPALVIWLARRNWADYGVSLANWPTNLDIGIKAYLVSFIPYVFGLGGLRLLGLDYRQLAGGALAALATILAIAIMIRILNRHKPVASGRANLILTAMLLLLPVGIALAMGKLSLLIVSTVIWQFVLSGFGEEFMFRGYIQSRLNQSFGRPYQAFGIQFGPGLLIAALLFGLMHAFNGLNPAIGLASMSWGWALWTFLGGLFGGIIREKTGTLLAPGIAHGLPDAIGEPLRILMGWV